MKPGVVGTVVVLLAGGALGGAFFLRDRSKLEKAQKLQSDGAARLASGDLSGAETALNEAVVAADQVTGMTGMRAASLDVQEQARLAQRLRRALAEVEQRPLAALRALDGLDDAPTGTSEALAKARAHLLLDAGLELEKRGAVEQAATVFKAAALGTKATSSDRHAEAEKGRRRMVLVTSLEGAEQAIRGQGVDQAAKMAQGALEALDGPGSPFEDEARVKTLRKRLDTILAEVKSGQALERYDDALRSLSREARTSALGRLKARVEALAPPKLEGGHRRAAEHTKRLETLRARHAWLKTNAAAFAGMVLIKRTSKGGLFMDRTEVTNEAYLEFVAADGYTKPDPKQWSPYAIRRLKRNQYKDDVTRKPGPRFWRDSKPPKGRSTFPVTGISYHEANAYAAWKKKRLPTLDEWRTACASDPYPWGSTWSPSRANVGGRKGKLKPVGSYPEGASRSGALDLIGNAMEIVKQSGQDKYFGVGGYYAGLPEEAKVGKRISIPSSLRNPGVGFRCVKELVWDR